MAKTFLYSSYISHIDCFSINQKYTDWPKHWRMALKGGRTTKLLAHCFSGNRYFLSSDKGFCDLSHCSMLVACYTQLMAQSIMTRLRMKCFLVVVFCKRCLDGHIAYCSHWVEGRDSCRDTHYHVPCKVTENLLLPHDCC